MTDLHSTEGDKALRCNRGVWFGRLIELYRKFSLQYESLLISKYQYTIEILLKLGYGSPQELILGICVSQHLNSHTPCCTINVIQPDTIDHPV
jgi:hypothetical protein